MSVGAVIAGICVAAYAFIAHLITRGEKMQKQIAKQKVDLEKEKINAEAKSMSDDELIDSINRELSRNDQK